jgi:hypothetical protein
VYLNHKRTTHFDTQSSANTSAATTPRGDAAKRLLWFARPFVIAGAILSVSTARPLFAQTAQPAAVKAAAEMDPSSLAALNKMGAYLRTLKSFQVTADVATDKVLEDGQTIQFSSKVNLVASRPNRLRVEITDDDGHRFFYFNGKEFSIFGQAANFYAIVPAPPTLGELTGAMADKYGIEIPLVDLFQWGTNAADLQKLTSAVDIGMSAVDGVTCEHYAFRQDGIDWQVWIQLGDFPIPRRLVIRTLGDDAKPQHSELLSWNLAPSFSEDAFTFTPPADAHRITLDEVKDLVAAKK